MKHLKKARGSSLIAALVVGLVGLGVARTAEASPNYPGLLQAALEKQFPASSFCVPLCTACHLTTVGGPGMLNSFGANLLLHGGLMQSNGGANDGTVLTSIQQWLGATPPAGVTMLNAMGQVDSDGDGDGDAVELQAGDSPSVPGARGKGQFCTDLKYGCAGGRIAAAPPVDNIGLLSAGLVVVGFAAMRRRRRLAKRAR